MKKTNLAKLKKRLFIVGCYLLVAAGLLVYVSYSHYRIRIDAKVYMPETYTIQASMAINQAIASEQAVSIDAAFLNELNPGSKAETYASNNDTHNCIKLYVSNADVATDGAVTNKSEIAFTYNVTIESTGRIPLEFLMIDSENNQYHAYADDWTERKESTVYEFLDGSDEIVAFNMPVSQEGPVLHKIYVGWDHRSGLDPTVYENIDLRKEVDQLKIRVTLVGDEIGDSIIDTITDGIVEEKDIIRYPDSVPAQPAEPQDNEEDNE